MISWSPVPVARHSFRSPVAPDPIIAHSGGEVSPLELYHSGYHRIATPLEHINAPQAALNITVIAAAIRLDSYQPKTA